MNFVTVPEFARAFAARNHEELKSLSFNQLQTFEQIARKMEQWAKAEYEELLTSLLKELIREQSETDTARDDGGIRRGGGKA